MRQFSEFHLTPGSYWKACTGLYQLCQSYLPPWEKGRGRELCHYFCRYEL